MLPPVTEATAVVGAAPLTVAGGTMKAPGFLRLVATAVIDGRTYRGVGTAGFAPEQIQPTQVNPPDFDKFWEAERARLAALPLDAKWTPLPDYGTADVECSQINLQNVGLTGGREPALRHPLHAARGRASIRRCSAFLAPASGPIAACRSSPAAG